MPFSMGKHCTDEQMRVDDDDSHQNCATFRADGSNTAENLSKYAHRPIALLARYVRARLFSHCVILAAVVGAVGCSVGTQYSVKYLVDALSAGDGRNVWFSFSILVSLIAGDNLLWRLVGWIASYCFVAVTGDLRADLFRYLTGHAPRYFQDRMPGTLSGRISATSNAVFVIENMTVWNVLPPCLATAAAIGFLAAVNVAMTLSTAVVASAMAIILFRLAAAGRTLHHGFADHAAAVDGEMVDVLGNMTLVRAFGGLQREHRRFDETLGREMAARRRSLRYIEKVRSLHAVTTIAFTIGMVAWAIVLWRGGRVTTGDVVIVCTLGFTILHSTRDLAVALVDVTQHTARLSEALATILIPHELRDHPAAAAFERPGGAVAFENVCFAYPGEARLFENFTLRVNGGERVGLIGPSGGGKSTLLALLQRFYDIQVGRILIDGQDIARVKQESLREAIALVPQDISLFHRSVLENIRYGRPGASNEEVMEAARAARCGEFIEALPDGMHTIVGDRGVRLSGGQRQRIAIARALLKDAPILLLDEATSALDIDAEEAIRAAFAHLMRGRTVIAIAHRLATLRSFDRIVVLQEGRIVQDGRPDQLMRHEGPYRHLIRREMLRLAESPPAGL